MIFHTEYSTYELDRANSRIRRVRGERPATARQGVDHEWRTYSQLIGEPVVGEKLVVVWSCQGDVYRSTITSVVTAVEALS